MRRQTDMVISDIKNRLNGINWDFDFIIEYDNKSMHPFNCRKYYSYPATFIPEIPYALIEILSKKGNTVVDPFGGIGTTFMQALILERKPFSFDINPIASDVCNTLYKLMDPELNTKDISTHLLNICNEYDEAYSYTKNISEQRVNLGSWYHKSTFNELAFLCQTFDDMHVSTVRDVMELVLTSILVPLSGQTKGWAYIADNVKPKDSELKDKKLIEKFKNTLTVLLHDIEEYKESLSDTYRSFYENIKHTPRVIEDSITCRHLPEGTVDLIITSPPYPRMIDYIKSQRLSFDFLNINFKNYVTREIGARYKRQRKDILDTYEKEILSVNIEMEKILKNLGFLCVVLPDYNEDDDRKAVIDKIVNDYKNNYNYRLIFDTRRYIPSHRRTLSIQWATLVNEKIYIFQKEG